MALPAGRLRRARHLAGLTQRELASRAGVSQPNIAAYERGARPLSEDMLNRLLDATGARPSAALRARREEVLSAASRHGASDVRVFGSVARGEDRRDSDVDLLVTFAPGTSLYDVAELTDELEELLGVRVDVVSERGLADRADRIRREAVPL